MLSTYLASINFFPTLFKILLIVVPIGLPIYLVIVWLKIRFKWLTMKYVEEQKSCLLEIKLPKEILKSPAAMEIFFSHLGAGGAGNWGEAFLDGKTRPWFSLEIVSTGGQVRFFVWCSQAKTRNVVEAQLYAQYPNLEIYETTEDYTKDFYFDLEKFPMAATQYELSKPDPYPIKTYIDYGLDRDQKEEYKIDPITSIIEYLGSLKAGENAWIQILIQKHEKEGFFHGKMVEGKDLKKEIQEVIKEIKEKDIPEPENEEDKPKAPAPTKGQKDLIAAIERSATKAPYDCMIRSIYITDKDSFNSANIGGLIGGLKQYGSNDLNGFKPKSADVSNTQKDLARIFPFIKKKNDEQIAEMKEDLLYSYKLRSYFQGPYKELGDTKPFVLTTEELATIFHFPSGMVSQTPTLKRVGSKKSEAPSNLPI